MDQEAIQALAQEIARHLPIYSWQALAIHMVLTIFAFCCGMIFADRIRARVTKQSSDASELIHETSSAGTDFDEGWREREWANLRRTKLEVLDRMHDCENFVGQTAASERDPLSELHVITILYFPELKIEVERFLDLCRARRSEASKDEGVAGAIETAGFRSARDQLSAAAQHLTIRIMGVAA
jgi:hypothetical protein